MITLRGKSKTLSPSSQQDTCSCGCTETWEAAKQETFQLTWVVMLHNLKESYHHGEGTIVEGGGRDGSLVFSSACLDPCPELKDHSPKSFQLPGGIINQHLSGHWSPDWVTVMNRWERLWPACRHETELQITSHKEMYGLVWFTCT